MTLAFADGKPEHYTMTMARLAGKEAAAQKLTHPGAGREWYIFKLTPEGIAEFKRLQEALQADIAAAKKDNDKHTTLEIRFITRDVHPGDGYYTFHSGKIPVTGLEGKP